MYQYWCLHLRNIIFVLVGKKGTDRLPRGSLGTKYPFAELEKFCVERFYAQTIKAGDGKLTIASLVAWMQKYRDITAAFEKTACARNAELKAAWLCVVRSAIETKEEEVKIYSASEEDRLSTLIETNYALPALADTGLQLAELSLSMFTPRRTAKRCAGSPVHQGSPIEGGVHNPSVCKAGASPQAFVTPDRNVRTPQTIEPETTMAIELSLIHISEPTRPD